mmetsp:Transcript_6611/g.12455  ORF Transcript_6611/g.12455 Transcript_6611/m.12455 type:complete len:489 (+) Transcript_6611:97-1563(+)
MSDTDDVPNDQLNQQDANTNKRNDLILDQGFPALNTFHLSLTKSSSSSSPLSSSSSQEGGGDNETLQLSNQDPIPRYPFASFPSALSVPTTNNSSTSTSTSTSTSIMDDLLYDCQIAFTARTKDESSAYSSGSTFFIPASMKPRCALERLALDIFQSHTHDLQPGKHYDLERSGAEWWTLVLDTSSARNRTDNKDNDNDGDDDDDDDDDEVGMHFDADYGLEHQLPHYMVHPRVATVTYLSNVGVPTLVLNRKSPPPTDVEKKTLNGPVDKGWLSYPMIGKHIAFDGRLLHGAPGTFFPAIMGEKEEDACGSDEKDAKRRRLNEHSDMMVQESKQHHPHPQRITFLVNIWLNHCPMDAELLDDELCQQMKTTTTAAATAAATTTTVVLWNLQKDAISNPPKLPNAVIHSAQSSKQAAGTDECVICGREVDIHYQSEMNVLHAISMDAYQVKGKSMEIDFNSNAVVLAVGAIVEDSSSDEDCDDDGSEE